MKLRDKIVAGLAALGVLVGISAIQAQVPGAAVLTTLVGTEYIQNFNATLSQVFTSKSLASYVRGTALLSTSATTSGSTATTAEQTLGSYVIPASTLVAGDMLRIKASWSLAANTDAKTGKCYFGSESISSGSLATNNKNASCELIVTNIAANQQIVYGNMLVDTTNITGYVSTTATETTSSPITIKFTATTAGTASDATLNSLSVELLGP